MRIFFSFGSGCWLFLMLAAGGGPAQGQDASAPTGALSPAESFRLFQVAEDLEIELVLAEPVVRQPVFLNFDERGRLWVVQYLQYPSPAGLKMTSRDNYWRAIYDQIPPPPPRHFPGQDKITIHEDTDGDGVYDHHKTFLEGLNIATAVTRGRGGIWVMNPPYLLFYADANGDDQPDADPVVHLSGFGLEDTHSVANSLRWGPDGWLYGAQGSTVTGNIIRPGIDTEPMFTMGQLIWRYHPESRRFEIFAEGGGNAFGVEIDEGGRVFSGHNGGNTRGFHYVQGGYFQKGFSKHGPLSNPYSFGYFPQMNHPKVERFTHTFLIYDGGALPDRYHGKLFGVEPLQSRIVLSEIFRDGSSFQTKDLGHPVTTPDKWFRPVDIKAGPDGAIYVADWYDAQVNHYRNHEGQIDKSNGRVYRVKTKGAPSARSFNLSSLNHEQLIAQLQHENKWRRQTALRLIADRRDPRMIAPLSKLLALERNQTALEAFWALNLCAGLSEETALQYLDHPNPDVRRWTIRIVGDEKLGTHLSPALQRKLEALAAAESNLEVRSQLASTSKRLSAASSLPIVRALLTRQEDVEDLHIPLLLWWSLESKCESDPQKVLALLDNLSFWELPMVRRHLLERLMRRFALAGTRQDLLRCAHLLEMAPGADYASQLLAGFEEAFQGRSLAALPEELLQALSKQGGGSLALQVRLHRTEALEKALKRIQDESAPRMERARLIQVLGEINYAPSVPALLSVLKESTDAALRKGVLTALLGYDQPQIAETVVSLFLDLPPDIRAPAETLLASRPGWSQQFLQAVEQGKIDKASVPVGAVRKMAMLSHPDIASLIRKLWPDGALQTTPPEEAEIQRLAKVIESGHGDPYAGKKLYAMACATCHRLFDHGGDVGPNLTAYQREDLPNMLLNIVHPSAEIREGFENFLIQTKDGRTLTGFLADQDHQVVVLRGMDGQNVVIRRDQISEMKPAGLSLMPEGLLEGLSDDHVRDLFAYLRSTQPLND